jgi:hypothetical protein
LAPAAPILAALLGSIGSAQASGWPSAAGEFEDKIRVPNPEEEV